MELQHQNIRISRTVCGGNVQCMSDGSVIVPDTKPDILKVIQVDSDAVITDKSIRDGKVIMSGRVNLKILYIPETDGDRISSITTVFDFSQTINCRGAQEGMSILASAYVTRAEFSVINSRKLHIKNIVSIHYEVIDTEDREIAVDVDDENAEVLKETISLESVLDTVTHNFMVQESLELPQGQPEITELLKTDINISDTEYKTVTGRIILKGTMTVCILYTTDDNGIEHAELEVPFTEVIDSDTAADDMDCDIEYSVINADCGVAEDSDGDRRVINADVDICAQVKANGSEEIEMLKDCYIPSKNTELMSETVEIEEMVARPEEQNTIREIVDFQSGVPSVRSVYNVVMKPYLTKSDIEGGKLVCEGKIEAYILYLSDSRDNPVYSLRREIPFAYVMDAGANGDNLSANTKVSIRHSGYNLNAAGEVELRCILSISSDVVRKRSVEVIMGAEVNESENSRGITIYFTDNGEELWDIAKRYAVPVSRIREYNNLSEGEGLRAGMRLFIPN